MRKRDKRVKFILISFSFLIISFVLGLSLGTVKIPVKEIWGILAGGPQAAEDPVDINAKIIWRLRFPRVCLALIEGAALSVAGGVMQGLFRNPMADPYIGCLIRASFGAVLGMVLV